MNFNDTKNLDVIRLTEPQLQQLIKWKDANEENRELIRNMKPIMNEAVIELGHTVIHFKENNDMTVSYTYFINQVPIVQFEYSKLTTVVKSANLNRNVSPHIIRHLKTLAKNENFVAELVKDVIMIHFTSLAYIFYYKPQIVEVDIPIKKLNKHAVRHFKRIKSEDELKVILRPYKKQYTLPEPSSMTISPLTKREIKASAWNVRGHMRTYKSGKTVYVKPYVKGKDKGNIQKKVYSISGS